MRLSDYSDYTLRVLMYCATHPERLLTVAEIAEGLQVSRHHLTKVVNDLARQGLLETSRGRGGGVRLLKAPAAIRIGEVLRASETDFRVVECFDADSDTCTLTPACRLKGLLHRALQAWFAELDAATLADMVGPSPAPAAAAAAQPVRMAAARVRPRPSAS